MWTRLLSLRIDVLLLVLERLVLLMRVLLPFFDYYLFSFQLYNLSFSSLLSRIRACRSSLDASILIASLLLLLIFLYYENTLVVILDK